MPIPPLLHTDPPLLPMTISPQVKTETSSLHEMIPPLDRQLCQRRVFLLRHGETDWNARGLVQGAGNDLPLNANGRQQAALVAREIAPFRVGVVVSSHLQRASQTAQVIRAQLVGTTQHVVMTEFGEMGFGELEGTALRGPESTEESRNKFKIHEKRLQMDRLEAYPGGGESTADVESRALQGLAKLYEQFPEAESFMIVAHGRFNKVLLSSLLYGDALQFAKVQQGNTCVNVIDQLKDGTYREVLLSYTGHIGRVNNDA